MVSSYMGEIQLLVRQLQVIDAGVNAVAPVQLTTQAAMAPDNTGLLMSVEGVVSDVVMSGDTVSQFVVTDVSGEGALVYINAYITVGVDLSFVEEGATVSITGLGSFGENASGSPLPRIRVRDRNEIEFISAPTDDKDDDKKDDEDDEKKDDEDDEKKDDTTSGGQPYYPPTDPPADDGDPTPPDEDSDIDDADVPLSGGMPFEDVEEGDWFYDYIYFIYGRGLMLGTGDVMFSPDISTTRAMIVTILWRYSGSPEADGFSSDFTDLEQDSWYETAVGWAALNKIVQGYGEGLFGPEDPVTRQDLAVILMNYCMYLELELPELRSYTGFADEEDIADYAKAAVKAFYEAGVINGRLDNLFAPKDTATRAEVAAMLTRLIDIIEADG